MKSAPITQEQFVELVVKKITTRSLARLRKEYGDGTAAFATRLGQLYRKTRGRGRRWQAIVAACRKAGLVA
jgi:hypothetical protein